MYTVIMTMCDAQTYAHVLHSDRSDLHYKGSEMKRHINIFTENLIRYQFLGNALIKLATFTIPQIRIVPLFAYRVETVCSKCTQCVCDAKKKRNERTFVVTIVVLLHHVFITKRVGKRSEHGRPLIKRTRKRNNFLGSLYKRRSMIVTPSWFLSCHKRHFDNSLSVVQYDFVCFFIRIVLNVWWHLHERR